MDRIRITIGSKDGESIFNGHFGESKYFFIFDLTRNGELEFVEKRENLSKEEEKGKHGLEKKRKEVLSIIKDVNVIIGRRKSPNFIKISEDTEYQPILVDSFEEIKKKIKENADSIFSMVERRKKGERSKDIPKLS